MADPDLGRLTTRLQAHELISLDTSVFIYHFAAHPRYLPLTTVALTAVAKGERQGVTSVITLMEFRTLSPDIASAAPSVSNVMTVAITGQ